MYGLGQIKTFQESEHLGVLLEEDVDKVKCMG